MTTLPAAATRSLDVDRLGWIAAAVVVVVAAALRFVGLGDYWLNPDEGIYYSVISWPDLARRQAEIAANAHPPFYYHFLWLWSRVSMDIAWLRVPAAAAGTVGVAGLYLLGREVATGARGIVGGLLAALALALSPSAITLSQLVRPYTLQVALLVFALWALLRWHHRRGTAALLTFSLCTTVALLTHYSSVFVLAAALVPLAVLALRRQLGRRDVVALAVASALPLLAVAWIYLAHVRPQLEGKALQASAFQTWLRPFIAQDLPQVWRQAMGVAGYVLGYSWSGVGIVALIVAVGVAVARGTAIVWLPTLSAFLLAATASLAHKYPFGPARHSVYLAPFLLVPIAWVVALGLLGRAWARAVTLVALVLLGVGRVQVFDTLAGGKRVSTLGDEQVLARADFDEARVLLDRLKSSPGLLVMSIDSSHTLCPLWTEERAASRVVEDMRVFRWGQRDVLVHSAWSFGMQGAELGTGSHIFDFLTKADRVLPELHVGAQRRLPMVFAGFTGTTMQALAAVDQERAKRGKKSGLVVGAVGKKGFGLLELDAAQFLAEAKVELGLQGRNVPGPATR
ncbi:MAG: glycosyltransferase family 39 protein [Planctomycetota bacterium]